jgi:uncharacterized protein
VMRAFLMDPAKSSTHHAMRPGRWVALPDWPAPQIAPLRLHFGAGRLADQPFAGVPPLRICSPVTVGTRAQEWCPYGIGIVAAESAPDQREDDALSLCFDSAPLERDLKLMGEGRVSLRVAADKPQAQLAVRLTTVAPDGASTLVTFGLLNLSHRNGSEHPAPMRPGQFETVTIVLKPVGEVLPAGHRLRIAVSTAYWPMMWPAPERATLTIDPAGSQLALPLLGDETGLPAVTFAPAERGTVGPMTEVKAAVQERKIIFDVPTETTLLTAFQDDGRYVFDEIATECTGWRRKDYSITRDDPASCATAITCYEERNRPDWRPRLETVVTTTTDGVSFRVTAKLKAWDGDRLLVERDYDETIRRDCL